MSLAFARHEQNRWPLLVAPRHVDGLVNDKQISPRRGCLEVTEILLPKRAHFSWRDANPAVISCAYGHANSLASALKHFR